MNGVSYIVRAKELLADLNSVERRMVDNSPAMKSIGQLLRTSTIRNFEAGGRPTAWAPLKPSTLKRRKGNKILRRQGFAGGLVGSISARPLKNSVLIGTNKKYAPVHQFGAKRGSFGTFVVQVPAHKRGGHDVRAHQRRMKLPWGDISARPFLLIHEQDWERIKTTLAEHVVRG
ncbi:MAG: phage virion morphogenesis protein [Desulfovibrio sp.]|uniref:phage virion morphogenesis protein n=1 Tax=Desulfovibrio sp. 7SRBS1 TaxID=3378064 RepID=UPI003B3E1EC1